MTAYDKECSKAITNIAINYPKLTGSLPIDSLLPDLYSEMVINDVQRENIQKEKLKKGKISYLFDEVIKPELESGISTKYDNLIKVMEASDDIVTNYLAGNLKGKFIRTVQLISNLMLASTKSRANGLVSCALY